MCQNLFYFNLNQILQKKVLPSVVVMVKGLALKLKITPNSKSELITLRLNFSMPSDKIEWSEVDFLKVFTIAIRKAEFK